jgi:Protein of unknown function (DUF2934)
MGRIMIETTVSKQRRLVFKKKEGSSMKNPTEEQIRKQAHEIYMRHGKLGRNVQDWLQAERELKQLSEGDEIEAADRERILGGDEDATVGSGRREEYKKGF